MLEIGDEAPNFAVGDTTFHGLAGEKGVILFFFAKAFSPG